MADGWGDDGAIATGMRIGSDERVLYGQAAPAGSLVTAVLGRRDPAGRLRVDWVAGDVDPADPTPGFRTIQDTGELVERGDVTLFGVCAGRITRVVATVDGTQVTAQLEPMPGDRRLRFFWFTTEQLPSAVVPSALTAMDHRGVAVDQGRDEIERG